MWERASAVLSVAEPSIDSRFRGLFLRNNDARGGLFDTFKEVYGNAVDVVESGEPRVTFKHSGSKIDVTFQTKVEIKYYNDSKVASTTLFTLTKVRFSRECFTAIYTRNRGTASWTGKVRMTTNPEESLVEDFSY